VKKIKRHGLAIKDRKGQVRGSGAMDHVAMKLEQGLGADGLGATVKSK